MKYADGLTRAAGELRQKIADQVGNGYDAETLLINVFSTTLSRIMTLYLAHHVQKPGKDLFQDVYQDLQLALRDVLAKHSDGKLTFAIEVPNEKYEKDG